MEIEILKSKIHIVRDRQIMLDFDLAELYNVETKRLKEAVRRNIERFPSDFMFELSLPELDNLRTNIATSSHGGLRYRPFAFTEQGVAMLSSVLRSKRAIAVNISIMRTFVLIRQYTLSHHDLLEKLENLRSEYDAKFDDVFQAIAFLLENEKQLSEQRERKRIGFRQVKK